MPHDWIPQCRKPLILLLLWLLRWRTGIRIQKTIYKHNNLRFIERIILPSSAVRMPFKIIGKLVMDLNHSISCIILSINTRILKLSEVQESGYPTKDYKKRLNNKNNFEYEWVLPSNKVKDPGSEMQMLPDQSHLPTIEILWNYWI